MSYELEAQAEVSVVEVEGERTSLHIRLADPAVRDHMGGENSNLGRLSEDLRKGDCVAILSGGRLAGYGYRKGNPSLASTTFRQIAGALQLAAALGRGQLTVDEYDTTGQYLAQYTFDESSQTYLKSKLRYLALLGRPRAPNGAPLGILPEVTRSSGRIRLAADGGLEFVSLEDTLVVNGAQLPIRSSTTIELRRSSVSANASLPAGLRDFALIPASEPDGSWAGVDSLDRARTKGASFRELIGRIAISASKSPVKESKKNGVKGAAVEDGNLEVDPRLFDSIAAALRSEKGAVAEAVGMTRSKPILSRLLIDALSAASCADCEAALIDLMKNGNAEMKRSALFGLARIHKPSEMAVVALKGILDATPYDQTALFGIGSYSRRFRDAGDAAKAAELGELLVQRMTMAKGPLQQLTALRAVENSGYAGALPAVRKFVDNPDQAIRRAAIVALGPMRDATVDGVVGSLLKDEAPDVKLAAIEAARNREPSVEVLAGVRRAYPGAPVHVRHRLVELLAHWLAREPGLRTLLVEISQKDPDEEVRKRAKAAL